MTKAHLPFYFALTLLVSCSTTSNFTKSDIRPTVENEGYLDLIENERTHRVIAHNLVTEFFEREKSYGKYSARKENGAWTALTDFEIIGLHKGQYVAKAKGAKNVYNRKNEPLYSLPRQRYYIFKFHHNNNIPNQLGVRIQSFYTSTKPLPFIKAAGRLTGQNWRSPLQISVPKAEYLKESFK